MNPLNDMAPQILFLVFAALMLVSATGVLYAKNQVNAAMNLVASFFFLAAIYALLYAHTLAVLQILVYAGAIMVLFLFVIMLLSMQDPERQGVEITPWKVVAVAAALLVTGATVRAAALGGVEATVTSVDANSSLVTFSETPFGPSAYAVDDATLGDVVTASGEVLHVTGLEPNGAAQLRHHLDSMGSLKRGDPVTLRWSVSQLKHNYGTVAEVNGSGGALSRSLDTASELGLRRLAGVRERVAGTNLRATRSVTAVKCLPTL